MKKVRMTIKTERTFDFLFDETKIDQEFIDAWDKHITDIKGEPESYSRWMGGSLPESMFPFVNLAENIAFAIHENDADHIEGLRFQDVTETEFYTPAKDPEIPIYYVHVNGLETEYELDLDETDTEDE